jgi:hypothetical protein
MTLQIGSWNFNFFVYLYNEYDTSTKLRQLWGPKSPISHISIRSILSLYPRRLAPIPLWQCEVSQDEPDKFQGWKFSASDSIWEHEEIEDQFVA